MFKKNVLIFLQMISFFKYTSSKYKIKGFCQYPNFCIWAWPDLNRRPPLCESDIITARLQAPDGTGYVTQIIIFAVKSMAAKGRQVTSAKFLL